MKIIDFNQICSLKISPADCVEWTRNVFVSKSENILPPKISMKLGNNIFFNTMPCFLATEQRVGVKTVSRYPEHTPALRSELMLFDSVSGNCLALMDATWITTMRTGAVAALATLTFQKSNADTYAFVGLGNTARATLLCLHSQRKPGQTLHIKLLRYKDQAEDFIRRFSELEGLEFSIVADPRALLEDTDVVISCVTAFDEIFAPDECYGKGILLVPVHTRGFQNCDLFFDKVFADDRDHVCGFKYFDRFRKFAELSDVLNGNVPGRETDDERILAYNIGIALHDIYFASKIFQRCDAEEFSLMPVSSKFWV